MRDIVTKVDTPPKNNRTLTIRTKTKYKNFEDYARLHREGSTEESETCSATSYMLKSKFKHLGTDLDLDKYKGRYECIKDDQESVGSDDSGVGSISETKDHTKYAAYNEFLSGYRKKQEAQPSKKKVVRSEIFIQVGDKDRKVDNGKEFVLKPVGTTMEYHQQTNGFQRQRSTDSVSSNSSEGTSKLNLTKMQNFNSIPRKFELTSYPKPDVAATIVKPVVAPNINRSISIRCDELDGGYEIVLKPKFPPAPIQLKNNLRSPIKRTVSNQFISNVNTEENTETASAVNKEQFVPPTSHEKNAKNETPFCIPPPPPFMTVHAPAIKCKPAPVRATSNASIVIKETTQENVSTNPMQMVFDEIRKRNTNMQQVNAEEPAVAESTPLQVTVHSVKTEGAVKSIPPPIPPPLMKQFAVEPMQCTDKPESCNIPPPPPPPMICDPNGSLRRVHNTSPPQSAQIKTTQLLEKERHNVNKPAPPPLQQELFKKLSEMNKKNQNQEESNETTKNITATCVQTRPEVFVTHKSSEDVPLPPIQPAQKYNTLSRFLETEKECLQQQQQQQQQYQSNTLERQNPKKKIVYNVYREMLGSYNSKANGIVAALPSRMVREDQGVKKQLESL